MCTCRSSRLGAVRSCGRDAIVISSPVPQAEQSMDRWADADDDTPSSRQRPAPLGNVAQHGISAFVKAGGEREECNACHFVYLVVNLLDTCYISLCTRHLCFLHRTTSYRIHPPE